MLFDVRMNIAHGIFVDAIHEHRRTMIAGSGIWFNSLIATCIRLSKRGYKIFVEGVEVWYGSDQPYRTLRFKGGAVIQFVDLEDLEQINNRMSRELNEPPEILYLVEDTPGAHTEAWDSYVRPFLRGTACRVVQLGDRIVQA